MKPRTLDINATFDIAQKNYGVLIQAENIQDVIDNSNFLEAMREQIVQNFIALVLLDCSKLIANDVERIINNGNAQITEN